MFETIINLISLSATLSKLADRFSVMWTNHRIEQMKLENINAIKDIQNNQDQRLLEKALGNPNAGEISHDPGAVVVDSLPGLHIKEDDKR